MEIVGILILVGVVAYVLYVKQGGKKGPSEPL
jgi:hypothetical protein